MVNAEEGVKESGGAPGPEDAPLPQLHFIETGKSPEPVIQSNAEGELPSEAMIIPYRDFTFVIPENSQIIKLFDNQALEDRGFKESDINSTSLIDWSEYYKKLGEKSFIVPLVTPMVPQYFNAFVHTTSFPKWAQHFVDTVVRKEKRSTAVGLDFPKGIMVGINTEHLIDGNEVVVKDEYILFYNRGNGRWIAFFPLDKQNELLPPRNWQRMVGSPDIIPDDLPGDFSNDLKRRFLLRGDVVAERLVNSYDVQVLGDAVVVRKEDDEIIFSDKIAGVGRNLCADPSNNSTVYYCQKDNPRHLVKLDTSRDPSSWRTEFLQFPKNYGQILGLELDPTGRFFLIHSSEGMNILAKDSLQEVGTLPKMLQAKFDGQGRIRGIDEEGRVVIYEADYGKLTAELQKRRIERIVQGLTADLFQREGGQIIRADEAGIDQFGHLAPVKTNLEMKFSDQLQATATLEEMSVIIGELNKLRARLQLEGLQPAEISFITQGIEGSVANRERVLAEPVISQGLIDLSSKLSGNLTIALMAEAKGDFAKLKSLEGLADEATRAQIRALENQYNQQSAELFRREGAVIEKDMGEMVTGVRGELEKMMTMPDFADWQEFRLPQLVSRLGSLANDCPIEAHETQRKILGARRQLQELSREYETKFKEQYSQVREKASEVVGERVELMKVDMDSLADRLRARGFKDRSQAETYVRSSEALEALRTEISELARQNPDAARELDRELKVRLATIMSEIERGGLTSIAETGQQMILFGNTLFPRWEGKVQEKVQRHVDLIFIPDERTKGPGVSADKVLGDIGIMEINSRGILARRRLYEGMPDEDERRYGSVLYRGEYIFPSYVSQAEYRKIKQGWADWSRGDVSKIRQGLNEKRLALKDWYSQRQPRGERDPHNDDQWGAKYRELLQDYAKFSAENHILLLSRVDRLRQAPETEFANGSGFIPEWQSHWTVDETTEHYLEEMAKASKMQLDLQEGLLNLKGHAGTGKDVLVKMFANRTNRPYFAIDCSKWTTEFELSEDVVLEAEDGASKTVKVPSVVLNAITTPGAVMYFNEINAMPEQAQIFLHGLMDEKRTLTLKTSSGKAVRTLDSVLLMGSMNPGYPGTFNPQFATKSRMVGLEIDYPSLYRERDSNDPNPNAPISAAEALRVARQVDSLADFTYEANPEHNEFVKIWDRHINGIDNGAPDLTQAQRFDLEAILTMVEFAQKLREGFILKFEKARASSIPRGTLLVDQPMTGREMRRMAYFLSKMSAEEKTTANPEAVTRDLIERFFLSHIDKKEERDEIRTAMATWTSSKRPAA